MSHKYFQIISVAKKWAAAKHWKIFQLATQPNVDIKLKKTILMSLSRSIRAAGAIMSSTPRIVKSN